MKFYSFWNGKIPAIAAVDLAGNLEFLIWHTELEFHFDLDPQTTWTEYRELNSILMFTELTKEEAKEKLTIWQTALSGLVTTLINGGK